MKSEELTTRGKRRSAAETEYYRVLSPLAADYERRVGADRWPRLAPAEALRELMGMRRALRNRKSRRRSAIVPLRRLS